MNVTKTFEGIIPPMLTPFSEDEELDKESLRDLVNFLIEGGVHGLFPCGTIGEFSNLSTEEIKEVEKTVIEETDGRVPVLAGTGASGTREAITRTVNAEEIGADGIITVTPYYLKTDQEGIREHFSRIAKSTELPIFLYHIPQSTGQELSADTVSSLEKKHDNIVGIKDSSGDLSRVGQIIRNTSEEFQYFQGIPKLLLASLVLGADGGVPGCGNIVPRFAVDVFEKHQEGYTEEAKKIQMEKLDPLSNACSVGPFPAGHKAASKALGRDLGPTRCPIRSPNEREVEKQRKMLENLNLL